MKIDNIELGLIPFGPAIGNVAIKIHIVEGESEDLFEDLLKEIKEKKYTDYMINACNATQKCFLIFTGGEIEKQENNKEWDIFNLALSRYSLDIQKILQLRPDQARPPFCIFVGIPKFFTGNRQFYQYFNAVYAIIKDLDFSELAFQEIINHQFSAACVFDIKIISDLKKKWNLNNKLYVIEDTRMRFDYQCNESPEAKYCLDNSTKYNINLIGTYFLELI